MSVFFRYSLIIIRKLAFSEWTALSVRSVCSLLAVWENKKREKSAVVLTRTSRTYTTIIALVSRSLSLSLCVDSPADYACKKRLKKSHTWYSFWILSMEEKKLTFFTVDLVKSTFFYWDDLSAPERKSTHTYTYVPSFIPLKKKMLFEVWCFEL